MGVEYVVFWWRTVCVSGLPVTSPLQLFWDNVLMEALWSCCDAVWCVCWLIMLMRFRGSKGGVVVMVFSVFDGCPC